MTYSQYAYAEAFREIKQKSWISTHVHMYEYFGSVAKILVPDNCKAAIIPAYDRTPKDKPNAEGTAEVISK